MRMIGAARLTMIVVLSAACLSLSIEAVAQQTAPYVGKWLRVEKYANGSPIEVKETATLVLTENSFASDSKGVPGAECDNSGRLEISGDTMTMTVTESTCPSIITVGSVVKSTFSVSTDNTRLTMTNTEWGYTYKEVLIRQ